MKIQKTSAALLRTSVLPRTLGPKSFVPKEEAWRRKLPRLSGRNILLMSCSEDQRKGVGRDTCIFRRYTGFYWTLRPSMFTSSHRKCSEVHGQLRDQAVYSRRGR